MTDKTCLHVIVWNEFYCCYCFICEVVAKCMSSTYALLPQSTLIITMLNFIVNNNESPQPRKFCSQVQNVNHGQYTLVITVANMWVWFKIPTFPLDESEIFTSKYWSAVSHGIVIVYSNASTITKLTRRYRISTDMSNVVFIDTQSCRR